MEKRNHACVVYLPVDWLHCYVICLLFRVGHSVGLRCECGGNEWRSVITFVAKTQMMMDTQMKYTGHCRETQRDIAERHRETLQRETERHCGETYRDFAERDILSVHTERDTERHYREENRDIAERNITKRHREILQRGSREIAERDTETLHSERETLTSHTQRQK